MDGQPLYVLDSDKVRAKTLTHTAFNGQYNGMVRAQLTTKPGERVRLYVLNAGPSNTLSFQVVGTSFDRMWLDGNASHIARLKRQRHCRVHRSRSRAAT